MMALCETAADPAVPTAAELETLVFGDGPIVPDTDPAHPFMIACPQCESPNFESHSEIVDGKLRFYLRCKDCGYDTKG